MKLKSKYMHRIYLKPEVRVRLMDLEWALLTVSYPSSQLEDIEEIDYEW